MKKGYYIGIILLAIIGGALSFVLRPQENELAYMNLQDKRFEEALVMYKKKYDVGDFSISVMIPLSRLYLQYGNVDKAADIMEEFVRYNPKSMEARKELGILYQFSQRPEDYLQNLEIIARIEPTPEVFRELSNIYNFNEQYQKQIDILERLISQFKPTETDILNLSYLHASHDDYDKALRAFDAIPSDMVGKLSPSTVQYILSLMLDTNENARAATFFDRYFQEKPNYDEMASAIGLMHKKGAIREALALLDPLMNKVKEHPRLLEEFSYAQMASGYTDESFSTLHRWFKTGSLPGNLFDPFVDLSIRRGEIAVLKQVMNMSDIQELSEKRLLDVAEFALAHEEKALAISTAQSLGTGFLARNPTISTALMIAGGKWNESSLVTSSLRNASNESKMSLIRLLEKAGYRSAALGILKQLEDTLLKDSIDFGELAWFYTKLGEAERGFGVFGKLEQDIEPSRYRAVQHGLLILAAGTGKTETVLPWIEKQTIQNYTQLEGIYFISQEQKHAVIALASAKKLYNLRMAVQTELYMADALLLNKQYKTALTHLRVLKGHYVASVPTYIKALALVGRDNKDLQKELAQFLAKDPIFKRLPNENKREAAHILLSYKQKSEAESIFFLLGKNASAKSDDVEQLLYLWGPYPPEYAEKWLAQRAKKAKKGEQMAWFKHLNSTNAYDQVIAMIENKGLKNNIARQDVYIEALLAGKYYKKLAQTVQGILEKTKRPKRLATLAGYAKDGNQMDLAINVYERLHEIRPKDSKIIKELGVLSYSRGDLVAAKKYLAEYIQQDTKDYLAYYYYGEILSQEKHHKEAKTRYNKVSELIVASPSKDINMRFIGALAQYRLGKVDEAFTILRQLINERPKDTDMRERFANLLIEVGMYSEAETVLSNKGS